jgi:hypothetical protein
MTKLTDPRSIVGIDPTHRGLAFVFFEQGRVRDWGTRGADRAELASLDRLLDACAADILVLEDPQAPGCRRKPRVRKLLRALARRAAARGRAVIKVSRADVRRDWQTRGTSSKDGVAAAIAERLPELRMLLPPPRKVYQSEDSRIKIFDAVSLVLHACFSGTK